MSIQPADAILAILEKLGSIVRHSSSYLEVQGAQTYGGFDVDLHDVGELAPAVAALGRAGRARFGVAADGYRPSARPRDRPAGGADRRDQRPRRAVRGDTRRPVITAQPLHGGLWRSYADHRMATAGAIVGLRVPGVEVEDIGTTAKTLPDFPQMWADMLAGQSTMPGS